MAWAGATLLLIIVLAVSWHIHPEAPGLVLVLAMFGPIFFTGLGFMLGPTKGVVERLFGVLLVFGTGWVLLWGFSLVR
jgi:hypothetical protein